jgi:hypothetical protein
MRKGDLVTDISADTDSDSLETGIVLNIMRNVEIPPLIEVLWDTGAISRTYSDDLRLLCKTAAAVVK